MTAPLSTRYVVTIIDRKDRTWQRFEDTQKRRAGRRMWAAMAGTPDLRGTVSTAEGQFVEQAHTTSRGRVVADEV